MTDTQKALFTELDQFFDGGEGSGNFDHEGRPGEVGGAGEGGGGSSPDKVGDSNFGKKSGLKSSDLKKGGTEVSNKIREYTSKMSPAEIEEDFKKMGVKAEISKLSPTAQQEIYASVLHSYQPYEDAKTHIDQIKVSRKGVEGYLAKSGYYWGPRDPLTGKKTALRIITINGNIDELQKEFSGSILNNKMVKGSETIKGLMDHEIGHVLADDWVTRGTDEIKKVMPNITATEIQKEMGDYASTSYRELFAEAWTMRQNSIESPIAKIANDFVLSKRQAN